MLIRVRLAKVEPQMNHAQLSVQPTLRLMSPDALRGFEMFCFLGGQQIVAAPAKDAP